MLNPRLVLFFSLLTSISICYGSVYKWTDKSEHVHYSDLPPTEKQVKTETKVESLQIRQEDINNMQKTNSKQYKEINKKLKEYKKIKEHHNDEDITPYLEQLNNKSIDKSELDINNKLLIKIKNCSVAKSNLDNLSENKNNKPIILDKKTKKLKALSKAEYRKEVNLAKKQVQQFCS